MKCTSLDCKETPAKIMAWPMLGGRVQFVAPYCDKHAQDVTENQGAAFAGGPALSDEAREIEGIRSQ